MTLKFSTVTFCRPVASSSADFGCETAARASACTRISRGAKQESEQAQIAWCSFGASAGVFTVGFIDLAFPFFPARRLAGWLTKFRLQTPHNLAEAKHTQQRRRSGADSEFKRRQQPAIQMSYKPTAGRPLSMRPECFFYYHKGDICD
jgi:hypothetical protein